MAMLNQPNEDFESAYDSAIALARLIWTYFKSLTDLGFVRDEALALVIAFQASMISQAANREE